jgi:hypothetical protein
MSAALNPAPNDGVIEILLPKDSSDRPGFDARTIRTITYRS